MLQPVLSYSEILKDGAQFHLTRARLSNARPRSLHGHDFFELIWVQNGQLRHHRPDQPTAILAEGDVLFIRPGDVHAIQGKGEEPLAVTLVLHPDLVTDLGARLGLTGYFWHDGPDPVLCHRDMRALSRLNQAALHLEQSPRTRLEAEAFLLPLLSALEADAPQTPDNAPDWLAEAVRRSRDPQVFRDGAAGFVALCGRAHPHVSRTTQRIFGQTPSAMMNALRMDHAARALAGTPDSLSEIAEEVGISNLSHFHKLFRARFGVTPHKYRKAHQADVVQPGA